MKTSKNKAIQANLTDIPLPQATDAEQVLLGALLLEPEAYDRVSSILSPESFYSDNHALIYATIRHLKRNGQLIDTISVNDRLKAIGAVISPYEITELTSRVASAGHIEAHAAIIAEKKMRRDFIIKAHEIIKLATEGELEETVTAWDAHGKTTAEQLATDSPKELNELLPTVIDELKAKAQGQTMGLTTGFPSLDAKLGGLVGGRVYIIGGRPGQGKTSIALNMAVHNAIKGTNVLFLSLEQTATDLVTKVLAGQAGLGHGAMDNGNLSPEQWNDIDRGISQLHTSKGKLFVSDKVKNAEHLSAIVRKTKKNSGLGLVVVDYIQLIPSTSKGTIREQEVAAISRAIKLLALSENLPILALSQLNREAAKEKESKPTPPTLSQLRESGSLEQDADVVIFVYRPNLDGDTTERADMGHLLIAKNRRGTLGKLPFFHKNMSQFSELPFQDAF